MAASFYSNSIHVDFESALAIGEPGMVSMFQALIASGLQGFLGCPAVVYEEALVEFFANGTVRDGLVVSTVNGVAIEISEKLFAETFDLPVDAATEERHWFDPYPTDLIEKWAAERPVVTASDTDEEDVPMDVGTADEDQHVQCLEEKSVVNDDFLSADEQMSLDDIILTIPVDIPLPSSSMEITKIQMGEKIKIPEVTERTWFLSSLPKIPVDHKGKAILVEKDPIKGNPAQAHFFLICADIDLLVELRAKIIDEVAQFFHSFSLRKLAKFNIEDMCQASCSQQINTCGSYQKVDKIFAFRPDGFKHII
ncbi:hypothetical protein F511_27176 [Dorcoceras hygrometricum]|uniref:Dystroglycan-like n=1 Tax=Dorcoceras hygrometricum TaxID=472368 RepID=A0A2Z7DGW8_9LAMI|nr:hypothetical protein F511_27176 [Dorcoceras hygrometricum]